MASPALTKTTKASTKIDTQHSNFWLDRELFDDDDDDDFLDGDVINASPKRPGLNLNRVMRLASVRRAITNFVQILTGQNIPVVYSSGKDSYTDGKVVVISAEDDQTKFDHVVGLALHEASHILLSDFDFLESIMALHESHSHEVSPIWWGYGKAYSHRYTTCVTENILPPALAAVLTALRSDSTKYHEAARRMLLDIKDIMNILEDRRIDKYVFQNAIGYRPYYTALYNKFFFTSEIGRNLKHNPSWRVPTVENYINRLLLSFHPASDNAAMVGLQALVDKMDLSTIDRVADIPREDGGSPMYHKSAAFLTSPALWTEACTLYTHILQYATFQTEKNNIDTPLGWSRDTNPFADVTPLEGGPTSPDDMEIMPVELGARGKEVKYNESSAGKQLVGIRKIMEGKGRKKSVTKSEELAISSIDDAAASLVDLTGDGVPFGNCIVTRKLTEQLLAQDWFVFGGNGVYSTTSTESITAGRRMGAILLNRLQVRNDPVTTTQTRLSDGGLDKRLLANLGMDVTSVFKKSRTDRHRPAMLHLSLDASGSMGGDKWSKVVTVATALAYISSKMANVDVVIALRGGSNMPMVAIVFDSRKDTFQSYCKWIAKLAPRSATPEGLCYKATMDLILETTATHQVYMINFSDGDPAFYYSSEQAMAGSGGGSFNYGRDNGAEHTKKMVRQMKEAGVSILSYFISDTSGKSGYSYVTDSIASSKEVFKRMYGEDAAYCDVTSATNVLRTLSTLLSNRET